MIGVWGRALVAFAGLVALAFACVSERAPRREPVEEPPERRNFDRERLDCGV